MTVDALEPRPLPGSIASTPNGPLNLRPYVREAYDLSNESTVESTERDIRTDLLAASC